MVTRSAEQILKEYKDTLGEDFGEIYFHAYVEWCDLSHTWKQFKNLFGHGPERVDLMNRAGAGFFYRVDRFFFEAVVMAVCRLSDPVKTVKKANLTVMLFEQHMDTEIRKKTMKKLLEKVEDSTEFARDWRNRRIGHNDFNLKVGTAKPLERITLESMDAAISALHKTLYYIGTEFMDVDMMNEFAGNYRDEMVMLNCLYRGDEDFRDEQEALMAGNYRIRREMPKWLNNS